MIPDVSTSILIILKVLILVALGLYSIFAGVLVRQEQLMAHVLEESFQPTLRLFVIVHLVISIVLFLLSFVLL